MAERQQHPGAVEDYTVPFLVSFCVLVFIVLFAIWAVLGFLWMLFSAWIASRGLARIDPDSSG